ncbi:MAG: hypothetical protein ABSF99_01145 [Anaerolineales bacterium]|jgi:hypothetical protein
MSSPITITLYSDNDEKKAEHRRLIVPWGFLKRAIKLNKALGDGKDISEEQIDQISDMLVEFFGGAFNREELEKGADVSEIMTCFESIVSKASGMLPNPKPPAV